MRLYTPVTASGIPDLCSLMKPYMWLSYDLVVILYAVSTLLGVCNMITGRLFITLLRVIYY